MDEINIKILLVGDTRVGKTSILFRYIDDTFPNDHLATIGVEYRFKISEFHGFKIKLQIWDTAGQERFHSITNNYFHNADGIIFVYDITDKKSFEGVKIWISESEETNSNFKKILLGNKCDLKHKRNISEEEVKNFCDEKKIDNYEVSAKDNINLEEAFNKIIELILKNKDDNEIRELYGKNQDNFSYLSRKKKNEVSCC